MYTEQLEKQQDENRLVSKHVTKSPKCNCIVLEDLNLVGIFVMQLPNDQRNPFIKWLYGQNITEIHGRAFAHATDYDKWYDAWIKGQTATVID